jgi:chorismate mutase
MVAELTALRDQIDEVDKALLDLLARRMALVAEVGEVKANTACRFTSRSAKPPCWPPVVKRRRRWAFRRI